MSSIKGISADAAIRSDDAMRLLINSVLERLSLHNTLLSKWFPQVVDDPSSSKAYVSVPPAAAIDVKGQLGTYIVSITNPQFILPPSTQMEVGAAIVNPAGLPVYHEISSATAVTFDSANNLVVYPVTPDTRFDITDPSTTRYFRLRSSYDQKNWNSYTFFKSNPVSSGGVTLLNYQSSKTAITGTGADAAMYTFTLPGGTLKSFGKGIRVKWASVHSSGTTTATYRIKLNGVTLATVTGTTTASAVMVYAAEIYYNTASSADVLSYGADDGVKANTAATATGGLAFASDQTLEADFSVAASDQVTPKSFVVELIQ